MDSTRLQGVEARHRVVVVGAGFGGLFATRALRRAPADVLVVDRGGYHLFQPLLYQVATGILSQGEVARPLRELLQDQDNADVLLGEVTDVDLDARTVSVRTVSGSTTEHYDSLVVAAGSSHSYFGNDGFQEFAPGLKSVDDALEIRARIFEAFELAEVATDPEQRRRHLTFAVVGGGPTGIEIAGQIRDLAQSTLRGNFHKFDPRASSVVLLEAGPALLPTYGQHLSRRTLLSLQDRGVDVRLEAKVVDVDATSVTYESGGRQHVIHSTTKVWAAGVQASPLGGLLALGTGATVQRSGQLSLEPDCTLPGHPEVFVVGDMMRLPGTTGVAQLAIQSGRFAAEVITRRLTGVAPPSRFRYRDKGSMATIARFRAVARIGPLRLCGLLAWLLWLGVHLVTLNGFRNRVTVTLHWAVTFVLGRRSERVTTRFQARHTEPATQALPRRDRWTG